MLILAIIKKENHSSEECVAIELINFITIHDNTESFVPYTRPKILGSCLRWSTLKKNWETLTKTCFNQFK